MAPIIDDSLLRGVLLPVPSRKTTYVLMLLNLSHDGSTLPLAQRLRNVGWDDGGILHARIVVCSCFVLHLRISRAKSLECVRARPVVKVECLRSVESPRRTTARST